MMVTLMPQQAFPLKHSSKPRPHAQSALPSLAGHLTTASTAATYPGRARVGHTHHHTYPPSTLVRSAAAVVDTQERTADGPALQPAPEQQPQGSLDWYDAWYPIFYEQDLDKKVPHRFELLRIPLVIWWDPNSSAWVVQEDLCPHRLVPLSEGRINTRGHLECGYHGWEFSASGKCERIPQGGNESSPRACVAAFPCAVRQGLLFVKPKKKPNPMSNLEAAAADLADFDRIPIVPELEDPAWVTQDTWRDVPLDYMTVLENVMDVSHVPFTHHKSISNRNQIGDFQLSLTTPVGRTGFAGTWPTGPRAGQLGKQDTYFVAPCYMKHTLDAATTKGYQALTIVYVVPMGPGRCRIINRNVLNFVKSRLPAIFFKFVPTWLLHISSQVPLEDDQIFLHVGEPEFMQRRAAGQSTQGAYFLASPADKFVAAFRSWLDKEAGGGPYGPITQEFVREIGPRLRRDVLLDRRWAHTDHCATCQQGLKQVQTVMAVLNATKWASAALALFTAAVAVARIGLGDAAAVAGAVAPHAGNPLLNAAAQVAFITCQLVAGGGNPTDQMLRAVGWGLLSAIAAYLAASAETLKRKFSRGDYPPQRNTATDP